MENNRREADNNITNIGYIFKILSAVFIAALSALLIWAGGTLSTTEKKLGILETKMDYFIADIAIIKQDVKVLQQTIIGRQR